jgi:hypothetical protein
MWFLHGWTPASVLVGFTVLVRACMHVKSKFWSAQIHYAPMENPERESFGPH